MYELIGPQIFEREAQDLVKWGVTEVRWVCDADHAIRAEKLPRRATLVFPTTSERSQRKGVRLELPCTTEAELARTSLQSARTFLSFALTDASRAAGLADEVRAACQGASDGDCSRERETLAAWLRGTAVSTESPGSRIFHALSINLVLGWEYDWGGARVRTAEAGEIHFFPEISLLKKARTPAEYLEVFKTLASRIARMTPDCGREGFDDEVEEYDPEICEAQLNRVRLFYLEQGFWDGERGSGLTAHTMDDYFKSPALLMKAAWLERTAVSEARFLKWVEDRKDGPEYLRALLQNASDETWKRSLDTSSDRSFYMRVDGGPTLFTDPSVGFAPACEFDFECIVQRAAIAEQRDAVAQRAASQLKAGCYQIKITRTGGSAFPTYTAREASPDHCRGE